MSAGPRHIKVTGHRQMFGYERCEDEGCFVTDDGFGSSCGRPACPSCGSGGANLTSNDSELRCTCGNAWSASPVEAVA